MLLICLCCFCREDTHTVVQSLPEKSRSCAPSITPTISLNSPEARAGVSRTTATNHNQKKESSSPPVRSPQRSRWAQRRFQHPNETRMHSSLISNTGFLTSWPPHSSVGFCGFEIICAAFCCRISAASVTSMTKLTERAQRSSGPCSAISCCCFFPFLCWAVPALFVVWAAGLLGNPPNCIAATSLSLTPLQLLNTFSWVWYYSGITDFKISVLGKFTPSWTFPPPLHYFHKVAKPASSSQSPPPHQLQHWLRYLDDFGYLDACLPFLSAARK